MTESEKTGKEWHLQVKKELRNHLVRKLFQTVYPDQEGSVTNYKLVKDVVTYARCIERNMHETAENREEYYQMLAMKIHWVTAQLEDIQSQGTSQGKPQSQERAIIHFLKLEHFNITCEKQ